DRAVGTRHFPVEDTVDVALDQTVGGRSASRVVAEEVIHPARGKLWQDAPKAYRSCRRTLALNAFGLRQRGRHVLAICRQNQCLKWVGGNQHSRQRQRQTATTSPREHSSCNAHAKSWVRREPKAFATIKARML